MDRTVSASPVGAVGTRESQRELERARARESES